MHKISYYPSLLSSENSKTVDFITFFENVKNGVWQDAVLKIRCEKDKEKRTILKKKLPLVTISGVFLERKISGLQTHSGLIAIDIDDIGKNITEIEEKLRKDKYTYAMFRSVSGEGLCVVVKIDKRKHKESFSGLAMYYFENYKIVVDNACKDVSRARFVSYDPDAFLNEKSEVFRQYIKEKEYEKGVTENVLATNSNLEFVISQIVRNKINICNNYHDWLKVGFAFANEFGEQGREYFRLISQVSAMYRTDSQAANDAKVNKQYDNCLKARGNGVTIKSFYYLAKQAGCVLQDEKTKKAYENAVKLKKSNKNKQTIVDTIVKEHEISVADAEKIVEKITQTNNEIIKYLKNKYDLKYNLLTEAIEIDNKTITERKLNTLYFECKEIKKINFEDFNKLLRSEFIEAYDPLQSYFESLTITESTEQLKKLFSCFHFAHSRDFYEKIITKWLVGVVGGAFGTPANFCIVLISEKTQIGKTTFFRNLLPKKISEYKAEINFDSPNRKDDLVPLTKNLLVLVDEWQNITIKNNERLKWIITATDFDIRKVFRKDEAKYKRIASIGGTSNPIEILNECEYNRRIIPVLLTDFDLDVYLAIDKDALFAEIYSLYKANFYYELDNDDIKELKEKQTEFEVTKLEKELLLNVVRPPKEDEDAEFFVASEILNLFLEKYKNIRNVSLKSIGMALRAHNFQRVKKKFHGKSIYGYLCVLV